MSPATHALDRRIYDLRSAHGSVTAELTDLESESIFALLQGGRFSGATGSRAQPALRQLAELRQGAAPLDRLLEEVSTLQNAGHLEDRRASELVALLNSASITVTAPDATFGPPRTVTPHALLTAAEEALAELRELVDEVDAVWQRFPGELQRLTVEADRLAAELPRNRAVAAARRALHALATSVSEDPLGAAAELAEVEATLDAAAGARERGASLASAVAAAAETLAEVEGLLRAGRQALERSRAEIVDPQGLLAPIDPAVVTGERGLRPWLSRLERLVEEGEVRLAEKGLERWRAVADQTLVAVRRVAEANAGPTRRRQELRGLLRAARVKAGAAGRAEDPRATELAERAERSLAPPCNLAVAEARVDAYLDELRRPVPVQAPPGRPPRSEPRPVWADGTTPAPRGPGWAPGAASTPTGWKELSA